MQTFSTFVGSIVNILKLVIPVITGLAFLAFVWGIVKFIFRIGDEKAVEEGKSLMLWGVIALFIMISLWGILSFFVGEFGFGGVGGRPLFGLPLLP